MAISTIKMCNIISQSHSEIQLYTHQEGCKEKREKDNKCWRGCGDIGPFVHCYQECKMVQLLQKIVQQFLKKLNRVSTLGYMTKKIENISMKNLYMDIHTVFFVGLILLISTVTNVGLSSPHHITTPEQLLFHTLQLTV